MPCTLDDVENYVEFRVAASTARSKNWAKPIMILLTNENYDLVNWQCIISTWLASSSMLADNLQMLFKIVEVKNPATIIV